MPAPPAAAAAGRPASRAPSAFRTAFLLVAAACAGAGRPTREVPAPPAAFDLVVRGGTLADGTGRPARRADVGIVGDRIAAVGDLAGAAAATTVDATGLLVAPGFVDVHSHHEHAAALHTAENMLRQGVTTTFDGPDGSGPFAVRDSLALVQAERPALNYGLYVGFNTVWEHVHGAGDRRPTRAELDSMRALVRRGMAEGAWGVSAGLDYKPGYFATADEVADVVSVARPWRASFPNHDRVTPESGYSSLAGMRETMAIGERAGLVPVFTHMKLQGHEQGRAAEALAMLDDAARRGRFAAADVYPYLAGVTGLSAFLVPGWAQAGGRDSMLARFREPAARARIARAMDEVIRLRFNGPANVHVTARGRTLAELPALHGVPTVADAVMREIELRDSLIVPTFGRESDLVAILRHPAVAVACDCGAGHHMPHPRMVGTYPRVLGRYVREQRLVPWEEAVRKMTAAPASLVGLTDRGLVAVGMMADLVAFDTAAVRDRATYADFARAPDGVRHVVVNGRLALHAGTPTGAAAGRTLTRDGGMPSRPARFDVARAARATASGLTVALAQGADADAASGRVRLDLAEGRFESVALGVLQGAPGWASVTGLGRLGAATLPFTLVLDARDPFAGRAMVTLTLPGRAPIRRPADAVRTGS